MTRRLGVVMDPIAAIAPRKDSTLAMLLEGARRGWALEYMELPDLRLRDGRAEATSRALQVRDEAADWFTLGAARDVAFAELDLVLMRKDPPVDLEFITATWILEAVEREGTVVSNRPQSLRDANEKLAATWFPECTPPSLVSRDRAALRGFMEAQGRVVLKPLDAMGGRSVFLTGTADPNASVILEEMTRRGARTVMAQRFLPAVAETGDKRILLVDGEPVPGALARIPAAGEFRANMAAGGRAEPADLTDRERWICGEIGPALRARGLHFVGIDVIDGWLTEINVTSPTGIRQIDRHFGTNVAGMLFDALDPALTRRDGRGVRSATSNEHGSHSQATVLLPDSARR
jgi:glutathione synthase